MRSRFSGQIDFHVGSVPGFDQLPDDTTITIYIPPGHVEDVRSYISEVLEEGPAIADAADRWLRERMNK